MTASPDLEQRGDLAAIERKLDDLAIQVGTITTALEKQQARATALEELFDDLAPVASDAMSVAVRELDALNRRGYTAFAKAGLRMVDRVVENFDEDDVEALGDNIVVILETVKGITQPEMLALLQAMVDGLEAQRASVAWESETPPSSWELVRKLRDPDVRRGIARTLDTLAVVSAETGPTAGTGNVTVHNTRGDG
jgi:uncharacterized protein YjgD (DUF1641 family)